LHQTTKSTPLRKIWSNKLFGVCGSDVILTLESDEKKVRDNRHWKVDVVYNTTPLPRRRDNIILLRIRTNDINPACIRELDELNLGAIMAILSQSDIHRMFAWAIVPGLNFTAYDLRFSDMRQLTEQ